MKQATAVAITITHGLAPDNCHIWVVKRGDTFLATVSFDGPRGTIVTHQGALYADERKEVYRCTRLSVVGKSKVCARCGALRADHLDYGRGVLHCPTVEPGIYTEPTKKGTDNAPSLSKRKHGS